MDVHTPELARRAGLPDNPGFDLLSIREGDSGASVPLANFPCIHFPKSNRDGCSTIEKRCIEVKGRAETGDIEVSANEWAKACNLRHDYWFYVVYDCASASPHLVRVQDPFGNLLARAKGSMLISARTVIEASEERV